MYLVAYELDHAVLIGYQEKQPGFHRKTEINPPEKDRPISWEPPSILSVFKQLRCSFAAFLRHRSQTIRKEAQLESLH